jgi:nitroreductase/NAD-dependent dihydropyrimidine dehydrogenase PreA subunit
VRFEVDEERCTHCGACVATCPTDMVRDKRGAIKISHVACIGCGHCMAICPEDAISLGEIEYEGVFAPMPDAAASPESLLQLLQQRRTVRRYTSEPVGRQDLERLIEATRWVPTGANCQCQQFVVMTDKAKLDHLRQGVMDYYRGYAEAMGDREHPERLASYGGGGAGEMHEHILAAVPSFVKAVDGGRDRLFFEAPAVILIHADAHEVLPEAACAFAAMALVLTAETLGLGTCITAYASMGLQALPELAREIGVPEGHEVYFVVTVGHPAERYQLVPPRHPAQVRWE